MRKGQKVSCGEYARARASISRERARAGIGNPLKGEILGAVVWTSSFMSSLLMAMLQPGRRFVVSPEEASVICDRRREIEISDYERGYSTKAAQSGPRRERYLSAPSVHLLMRDLGRPGLRKYALDVLMSRIPDPQVREWAHTHVLADDLNRLSVHVRPGMPEEQVWTAWRDAINAELIEAADKGPDSPADSPAGLRGRNPRKG